jgi:hypothetical protein
MKVFHLHPSCQRLTAHVDRGLGSANLRARARAQGNANLLVGLAADTAGLAPD